MTGWGHSARRAMVVVFRRLPKPIKRLVVQIVTPSYTLGSVVLLRDENGRLLLLRQPPDRGWSLPGGHLNRGEEPLAAAVRELREEIGVHLSPEHVQPAPAPVIVIPRSRQVDFVFTATVSSSTPIVPDGVEIGTASWHDVAAITDLTVGTKRVLTRCGILPADNAGFSPGSSLGSIGKEQ